MKRFFQWLLQPVVLGTIALVVLSAIVWWVGPLVAIAGSAPLASVLVRVVFLVLLWSLWLGRLAWVAWQRRRTNAALLAGLAAGPSAADKEAQVLTRRFAEAVERYLR